MARVELGCTDDELARWKARAASQGMTVSESARAMLSGKQPKPIVKEGRLLTVKLTEGSGYRFLRSWRASMPGSFELIECHVAKEVVVFTISSNAFRPVPEGEPIPELAPRFL